MPFLFHKNKQFTWIQETNKNGVICQVFAVHPGKPLQIISTAPTSYAACMSETGKLHVITMPDAYHLNYHVNEGNHFTKQVIIANTTSSYTLSSPMVYLLDEEPYITYISYQEGHAGDYNFVQDCLTHTNLKTLLTIKNKPEQIKYFKRGEAVYIFFISYEGYYQLSALRITSKEVTLHHYLSMSMPIIDYSVCFSEENELVTRIAYVTELHGKFQLMYWDSKQMGAKLLLNSLAPCMPALFSYYHALWINVIVDQKVCVLLSIDQGENFSMPVPCSLQNNMQRCYFTSYDTENTLSCTQMYASITSHIKLATIAQIDLDHFHHDTNLSPEVELLLEGLSLAAYQTIEQPKEQQVIVSEKVEETILPKVQPQDVDLAKKNFMNQLNGWDFQPRI